MSLGGQSDIYAAQGGIPSIFNRLAAGDASGGIPVDNSKYAQIMELMRRRNAMTPQSYTGGYGSFAATPASSGSSSAYDEILRLQALNNPNRFPAGDRGKTDGESSNPGWDAMTDAQKAAYYAENPTMGKITQFGQNLFGYTTLGLLQKALDPTFVSNQSLIARGIDPANLGYLGGILGSSTTAPTAAEFSDPLSGGWGARDAGGGTTGSGFSGSGAAAGSSTSADVGAVNSADVGGWGGRDAGGGTEGGGPASGAGGGDGGRDAGGDTGGGPASGAGGGDGGRDAGGDGGGDGGWYKGGQVTMNRLLGPNPMGPDDGYGGLDDGEYVINAKSVGKYGIELMNAINAGKISKGKLRGLLEA